MQPNDKRHKGSIDYMPFSYGRRKCPSEEYALLVARYFLVRFCQTFESIEPGENEPYKATTRVGTTIRNGLWLKIHRNKTDIQSSADEDDENRSYDDSDWNQPTPSEISSEDLGDTMSGDEHAGMAQRGEDDIEDSIVVAV